MYPSASFLLGLRHARLQRPDQKKGNAWMLMNNEPQPFHLRGPRWVIWILVSAILIFLLWAATHRIDSVARASGTVIASSRVQVIQSVDGGVLDQLLVREGDRVVAGQKLAVLSQDRAAASVNEIGARLAGLRAQEARLRAEVTESAAIRFLGDIAKHPETLQLQRELFEQRRRSLQEELRSLRVAVDLAQEEAKLVKDLSAYGDVSRSEVIRVERALNDAHAAWINRRNKFFQDARAELAKTQDDIAQNSQIYFQRAE
jgi:membrane fusion protein, adhesin transport system